MMQGIKSVTQGDADLRELAAPSAGQVERYGLGEPVQIGPSTAALFCNRRTIGGGHWDYEDGTDVLIFNDLDAIAAAPTTTVAANETEPDRKTGGVRVIVKYPINAGFVPLGVLNSRGLPHPHAGTGFGICVTLSFLIDDTGYYDWRQESIQRVECRQFSYDGVNLHVDRLSTWDDANPLRIGESEWSIHNGGLCVPIPDGDDLLGPLLARRGKELMCGVCRWRREAGQWRPTEFLPVAAGSEPSMVRDLDGAFLFSVRSSWKTCDVKVWRSSDQGRTWTRLIGIPHGCDKAPVSLNRAADGTPYIAANLHGDFRAKLCLWPLNDDRTGLLPPLMIRDCGKDFGAPPEDTTWFADHPVSSTLRLADGALHGVLTYRVMAFSTAGRGKETITPATGYYVEEVESTGRPAPIWEWAET